MNPVTPSRANLYLGLISVCVALLIALVWVPFDTDTGLIEKVRRRVAIGDALAPTIAAAFVGFGGLLILLTETRVATQARLSRGNVAFAASLLALFFITLLIMRWAGPFALLLGGVEEPYRTLRDTAPWKWVGFALGGICLITSLISVIERRFTFRALVIGVASVVTMIAVFDLPFDDLLLPPNGDV